MADAIPAVVADVAAVTPSAALVTTTTATASSVTTNGSGVKKKMSGVFGACIVIALLGYTGLTLFSMVKWTDGVSHSLITGYVVFVSTLVGNFTKWMES